MVTQTPEERKEHVRQYNKEYCRRPEVKARMAAYAKIYAKRPEVREKMKTYYSRPDVAAKRKKYYARPEIKARWREWYKTYDGRCKKVLREHHELMKDDPEHLTTEFLAELVGCNCPVVRRNEEELVNWQEEPHG